MFGETHNLSSRESLIKVVHYGKLQIPFALRFFGRTVLEQPLHITRLSLRYVITVFVRRPMKDFATRLVLLDTANFT